MNLWFIWNTAILPKIHKIIVSLAKEYDLYSQGIIQSCASVQN